MIRLRCLFGALTLVGSVFGQSTYLPEVEVSAERIHSASVALMEYSVDSALWKNRAWTEVSDILRFTLPAVVRQYGPGMITTIRVRGLASEHFKVIWNGLSLNNAALGLFDLSGVAGISFDRMSFYQGNMAANFGSGAGGGAMMLSSSPASNALEVQLASAVGSFGYRQVGTAFGGSYGRLSIRGSINQHLARNDFGFTNLSLQPQRLANGSYLHTNVNMDFAYQLAKGQLLQLAVWNQKSLINIPPSRVESRFNTSRQWNDNFRSVLILTGKAGRSNYVLGGGWISEQIVYQHDLQQILDTSLVKGFQTFGRGQVDGRTWKLYYNAEFSHVEAPSVKRSSDAQQTLAVFNGTIERRIGPDARLSTSWRQEWMDGVWAPAVIRLAGEWQRKALNISTSAGNHFRWPTLNERFWVPGGNQNLNPESGYTMELGVKAQQSWNKWLLESKVQPFVQWIDNLIIWQPIGALWSPVNVRNAHSRGIEAKVNARACVAENQSLTLQIHYTYNRTSVTSENNTIDGNVGKYLIYSPLHMGSTVIGYYWNTWNFAIAGNSQSAQHTLSDNHPSGVLRGFAVFNLLINRNIPLSSSDIKLGIEVRNIFNTEYQMIADRPMPGREFRFNLIYQFIKPKIHSQ